jgi:hypothetical protein
VYTSAFILAPSLARRVSALGITQADIGNLESMFHILLARTRTYPSPFK